MNQFSLQAGSFKRLPALFFLLFVQQATAQTFTTKSKPLYDYYGYFFRQEISIAVNGLPDKCDTAFGLESVLITIHHPRVSDLKITLESPDGSSIWLTNRNGKDSGHNYINTRFSQHGKDGLINTATSPFTGSYHPDGQLEYLNNGQNPNGIWKLYIEDLKTGEEGFLDSVQLTFSNKPAHITVLKKCASETIGLCSCYNGKQSCTLLPDLVIIPFFTQRQIQEYAWDDKQYPGQLRLAAAIGNIGYGPMEIKGTREWFCGNKKVDSSQLCPNGRQSRLKVKQIVYTKDKDSLKFNEYDAGSMYFENKPGHNHFHVDDWVEFRLVKMNGKRRTVVAEGNKVSFCLFTNGMFYGTDTLGKINGKHFRESMANYGLGNYPTCNFDKQGIAVGGYDFYGMMYEGQYLQLPKGLQSGEYVLEIEIDPNLWYKESNKANNIFMMKINISKQQ